MGDSTASSYREIDLTAAARYFSLLKWINVWFICAALNYLSSLPGILLGLQGPWSWPALVIVVLNSIALGAAAIPAWKNVSVLNSLYQRWTLPSLWFLAACMVVECGLYYWVLTTSDSRDDPKYLILALVTNALMLLSSLLGIFLTILIRRRRIDGIPISFASLLGRDALRAEMRQGHPRRRKPRTGWALAILGFSLLFVWNSYGLEYLETHEWIRVIEMSLAALPYLIFLYARSFLEPVGEDILIEDGRAPVLLLRSYSDQQHVNTAFPQFSFVDYSLDARLAIHFRALGPFITVGSPEKEELLIGPARLTLSHEEWKQKIRDWMKSAQLIVLMIGITEAVHWELNQLIELRLTHKLVVGFPELRAYPFAKKKCLRSRKSNALARLEVLQSSVEGTQWAAAMRMIRDPLAVRSLVLEPDGGVTVLRSKSRGRGSYHLAVLLGEYLARRDTASRGPESAVT